MFRNDLLNTFSPSRLNRNVIVIILNFPHLLTSWINKIYYAKARIHFAWTWYIRMYANADAILISDKWWTRPANNDFNDRAFFRSKCRWILFPVFFLSQEGLFLLTFKLAHAAQKNRIQCIYSRNTLLFKAACRDICLDWSPQKRDHLKYVNNYYNFTQ